MLFDIKDKELFARPIVSVFLKHSGAAYKEEILAYSLPPELICGGSILP